MKKTATVLFLIFIITSFCFSQDNSCKKGHCLKGDVGYVFCSLGPSIPLGDFGLQDVNTKSSGFAEAGYKIELNGGYHLKTNYDLSAKIFYSIYNYDVTGLQNLLRSQNPGTKWHSNGRSWDLVGFLAGVLYERPLAKKFVANARLLLGIIQASTSDLSLTETGGAVFKDNRKSGTSLSYSFSVGGVYPIGRLIDVVGNFEYIYAKPSFDNVNTKTDSKGNIIEKNSHSVSQNLTLLAFNFGVSVKF